MRTNFSPTLHVLNLHMYKKLLRYRLQFRTDFHEIQMIDAGPPRMNPIVFENIRGPIETNVPPKIGFSAFIQPVSGFFLVEKT